MRTLQGSKSGSSATPSQSPDTLSSVTYAQVLDLISEGPIYGPPTGQPAQSIYLNDVPLMNSDGTLNFTTNQYDFRYGEVDQSYISGFASSAQANNVGVYLYSSTPWTVAINDMTVNAVVVTLAVESLSSTDPNSGDVSGYQINYQILVSIDQAPATAVVSTSFNGKCTSEYQRSHTIPLSGATSSYTITVVRTTANANSVYIEDTTSIVSYTTVIDGKLTYPCSALAALSVDAVQFSSMPTRSYDMMGLLVQIPSNYNPTTRAYTGTWDGTFTTGWTNNPAWVFYDLVLNERYGLGQWVNASQVDRYGLYQIAQYCDVLVSDGMGGQEPRFTCNCYIQSRADAYKVLQDIASVFRGMAYWGAGTVSTACDMPLDPVYVYTQANVIGGQFKYVGSSLKNRYTTAIVGWNNPNNDYKVSYEYVEDADGVARYGVQQAQITAFGCTSQGQAQRVGLWSLLTSRYETNTVTFSVGLDGTLCQPGQIIAIADPGRAGVRTGGRMANTSGTDNVTLDVPPPNIAAGDTLTVILPSGVAASSTVSGVDGGSITVNPPFAEQPNPGSVWMWESTEITSQLFRVLSVAEKEGITFEISATQYEPSKFAAIDDGAAIDVQPITGNTFTTQVPPTGVTVNQYVVIDQGIAKTNMTIAWVAAANAVSYSVQWQKDNGTWVDAGTTGGTSLDVSNIYGGGYIARVLATNGMGIASVYAFSTLTALQGKTGTPPVVASLTASTDQIFEIDATWSFPTGAGDTAYTEVWYSKDANFNDAVQLGTFSYPTNKTSLLGLAAGVTMYFWARLVDTSGNIGPWYPSSTGAGVAGQSSSDASAILTYLPGQISSSQLAQELLSAIQTIEPPEAGDATSYAGDTTSYAGVWSLQTAQQTADLALAQQTEAVGAQLQSSSATLSAAIQTETTARVTAQDAMSEQVTTVQAQVNNNTAAVQTVAQSYASLSGQLSASYTITTQVTVGGTPYIAGIGIGINAADGVVTSSVYVAANQFAIVDPNGTSITTPFAITGGQCFINSAVIGNGFITNAMIGQTIQSTAVGANGQPLWILDKLNGITFNGPNGGSGYLNLNSSTLTVYDQNGTLRVRLGLW